jgi:alkanesulfonate monooxygenase SsuD/methylene tetrahydromethanopterin reductase-like flavin-dependent oxidoreductase (luciferase family)
MGERRTLRIVAELADEWNSFGITIDDYKRKTEVLEGHCDSVGRDPAEITHSQMSNFIVSKDDRGIRRLLGNIGRELGMDPSNMLTEARSRGWLVGTPSQLVEEIGKREEAGISRLMLEHPIQHDFEVLELLATEVLPQVQG